MLNYLVLNNILTLQVIINTFTAYVMLGLFDNILVPICEQYMLNEEREILYHRFCVKLSIWLCMILFCFLLDLNFM